jgi:hypothetical protein
MEPYFSWRKTRASDVPACLALRPAKNGAETVGAQEAAKAWQQIFSMTHAARGAVAELHAKGKTEIVGWGLSAFVTKSFAEAELATPMPGVNCRIVESVLDGNCAIASYDEVRDANTRGDLQQVNLNLCWDGGRLEPTQVHEVLVILGRAYQEIYAGYRLSRVMTEFVDELDFMLLQGNRSIHIVDRFEAYRLANPATRWNADRALAMATIESTRVDPHSVAAELFLRRVDPQFRLARGEQELLELALEGMDDGAAAKELNVSLPGVKHRWASIFERVAEVRPDLCPRDVVGARGIQ